MSPRCTHSLTLSNFRQEQIASQGFPTFIRIHVVSAETSAVWVAFKVIVKGSFRPHYNKECFPFNNLFVKYVRKSNLDSAFSAVLLVAHLLLRWEEVRNV